MTATYDKPTLEELTEEYAAARQAENIDADPVRVAAIRRAGRGTTPDYDAKIRRLGNRIKGLLATPAPHDGLSETRMAITCALVKRNFTAGEVYETLAASPWLADLARRKGDHAEELIATEIAKAQQLVTPFPPAGVPLIVDTGADHGAQTSATVAEVAGGETQGRAILQRFPRTDAGQAELFACLNADRVRYDHRRRVWLIWAGHWWQRDNDGEILRLAKDAARRRYLAGINIENQAEREAEAKFAIQSENRAKIEAMLALAAAERPLADTGEGWDADPWLIGVKNGVVELRSGTLRNGRPDDRISRHAPVVFDPAATSPVFERFMASILPPSIVAYEQRLAGIALTGDVSEQIIAFRWGAGNNGKSTYQRAILGVLGPDYGQMAAPGLLLRKRSESHPTELADIFGARLVVTVEVEEGRAFAEAALKQMTGGDLLKARFMHGDFFGWAPTHKLWMAANHKPVIRGTDDAIWRRIRLIPYDTVIPAEQRDPHLGEKLAAEAAGILNWMLAGCLAWQRDGLNDPEEVLAAGKVYRNESDVLQPFIDACCVIGPDKRVAAGLLFQAYKNWAEANMSRADWLNATKFGLRAAARWQRRELSGNREYVGIGLRLSDSTSEAWRV